MPRTRTSSGPSIAKCLTWTLMLGIGFTLYWRAHRTIRRTLSPESMRLFTDLRINLSASSARLGSTLIADGSLMKVIDFLIASGELDGTRDVRSTTSSDAESVAAQVRRRLRANSGNTSIPRMLQSSFAATAGSCDELGVVLQDLQRPDDSQEPSLLTSTRKLQGHLLQPLRLMVRVFDGLYRPPILG